MNVNNDMVVDNHALDLNDLIMIEWLDDQGMIHMSTTNEYVSHMVDGLQ